MPKYPDWVNKYRSPGMAPKKVGDSYYLYKTTSVRVPGKKNPQPQSIYVGVITREGVIETNVKKVDTTTVRVYEYGFSYATKKLLPKKMIKTLGDQNRADEVLRHIVSELSPTSYLLRKKELAAKDDLHTSISPYKKMFEKHLGMKLDELLPLKGIYLVEMGDQEFISEIPPECEELLIRLGVTI